MNNIFKKHGDPVLGQPCPRCHQQEVVYNGNYWCNRCTWVMPEKGKHNKRIIKAYLNQCYFKAKDEKDKETMETMLFYLRRLE